MQLTQFSDYGLRVLISLGLKGTRSSIREISRAFDLSENHLAVVVHRLSKLGYVHTFRGRGGGIQLAVDPADITIGVVVEQLEPHFTIAECLDRAANTCRLMSVCRVRGYLAEATRAFLQVLHRYSLADVLANGSALPHRVTSRHRRGKHQGGDHGGER